MKEKIEKLRLLKRHYDLQYWRDETSDERDYDIYDQLKKEFFNLLEQYPEFKLEEDYLDESRLANSNGIVEVTHKYKMLSLAKALSLEEFIKWSNDIKPQFNKLEMILEIIFEFKIDGLAVSLEYENGKLLRGSTRGDGWVGEDITPIVFQIEDIPKKIKDNFTGEIGGEIYMKKSSLIKLNEELISQNKRPMKNVRNAASGIVKRKNTSLKHGQYLNFLCYRINCENSDLSQYDIEMNYCKELGFKTVFNLKSYTLNIFNADKKELEKIFKLFQDARDGLDFDIDGVVIKINNKQHQEILGEKENTPKWAIAYKFPAVEKLTTLLGVEWELGDKGNITPMAVIEPVDIGGTTVKRPTLHNLDELKRLGLKIGDVGIVSRRGDVIPKFERILAELRTGEETEIQIPTKCPECEQLTTINGAYLRCDNENCKGRLKGRIMNFVNSMDIDNMGVKVIQKLVEAKKLKNITNLFDLKVEDIEVLERMAKKSATNVINNIEKSRKQPLWRIIMGLSIPNVGMQNAKSLEKNFKSLENLINITIEQLTDIDDIGPIIGFNISDWFNNENNIQIINRLIELNVVGAKEEVIKSSNKLEGLKIAFTGALSSFSRKECEQTIKENGGESWGIKKEITHLLIGEGAKPAKIEKAEKLNAIIITEKEFLEMLK